MTMNPNTTSTFPQDGTPLPASPSVYPTSTLTLYFILLGILPLAYGITPRLHHNRTTTLNHAHQLSTTRKALWCTTDLKAFFGLLLHTLAVQSAHHPFAPLYFATVQQRWADANRRDAIRGLLERGVVPLVIHDWGLETTRVRAFSWVKRFPWVRVPVYRQAVSRAYIEFAVPNCEGERQRDFIGMIKKNNRGLQVSLLRKGAGQEDRPRVIRATANPPVSEGWQPLMMGAESAVEALLPFLPDRLIKRYAEVTQLKFFLDDWYYVEHVEGENVLKKRLPCLHNAQVTQVCVESKLWSPARLEQFVFNYAISAGLERSFSWSHMDRALHGTVANGGVNIDEF
ncbi:hypothetical protein J1614_003632 [Plenodomus biglobosus]|nr:hypothetical protein J1614_003632 [Plenodomus biglobosus]